MPINLFNFPVHMAHFWRIVNKVIRKADIILLVIDARFPELTRHPEIEKKVREQDKKLLYVINKSDLVKNPKFSETPHVFVSSRDRQGSSKLFKKIMELAHGEEVKVGVLGYPNVGKSSVINMLKGKKSAKTSSQAGYTKGIQYVTARNKLLLIDTPGVLPFTEKDLLKQITIGAFNPQHVKEPDYYAMLIIKEHQKMFEKYYDVKFTDADEFLDRAALKHNYLKKGGKPDRMRFARKLLHDWQQGHIHDNT